MKDDGDKVKSRLPLDQGGKRESSPAGGNFLEVSTRERTAAQITDVRGDIEHICNEIEKLSGQRPQVPFTPKKRGPGRPRSALTPRAELDALDLLRAVLHSQLIRLRGEPIFAVGSGFDKLAALGIIAAPAEPAPRGRGRPKDKRDERIEALRFWVSVLTSRPLKGRTKELTIREAIRLLQPYMREHYKTHSDEKVLEVGYHRELRRLRNRHRNR